MKEEQHEIPELSRSKVGKNRWIWACWPSFAALCELERPQYGYADTSEEAERQAIEAAKELNSEWIPSFGPASFSANFHRRLAAEKKAAKMAETVGSQKVEYLWSEHWAFDGERQHRIVKRTPKRVFVEQGSVDGFQHVYGDWRDYAWREMYALDRQKLDADGEVWCRSAHRTFYTEPWEGRQTAPVQSGRKELRKQMAAAHPDRGGDPEEFKRLQKLYEQAM